jgi:hypothetical protein
MTKQAYNKSIILMIWNLRYVSNRAELTMNAVQSGDGKGARAQLCGIPRGGHEKPLLLAASC